MKRFVLLTTVLAIAVLAAGPLVMAQAPVTSGISSAPNLVNFQGKLTLPTGNPVPDGPHTFIFRIFPVPIGGGSLWTEGPLGLVTTGGLFTYQLGTTVTIPGDLFDENDALWLEVEADGGIITPRTRLISTPYARAAQDVEASWQGNDSVYARTRNDFCGFSTYSVFDGIERVRLWGCGYGEIYLSDGTGSVNTSIGGPSGGGYLSLSGGPGASFLTASTPGDGSVNLPTDAVNAAEMLNEPGIGHDFTFGPVVLGITAPVNVITITAPTAGFVVVTAHGFFTFTHTLGTSDILRACIDVTPGTLDFDNFAIETYHSSFATAAGIFRSFSLTKVEAVAAGAHTYFLNAGAFTGAGTIERRHLTAVFYPTAYGPVISTVASKPGIKSTMADGSDLPPSEVKVITAEEHKAQVAAEQAKLMADLQTRLKKLEEAAKQGKQQTVEPNR